jgi:hypothetical protein
MFVPPSYCCATVSLPASKARSIDLDYHEAVIETLGGSLTRNLEHLARFGGSLHDRRWKLEPRSVDANG